MITASFKSFISCFALLFLVFCFSDSNALSVEEQSLKEEVEEILKKMMIGKDFEYLIKEKKFDANGLDSMHPNGPLSWEATKKREKILPLLAGYIDAQDSEQREAAIRLIGNILRNSEHMYSECCPSLTEDVYIKLLSILNDRGKEGKWIVDAAAYTLRYVKDARVIPPLVEGIKYYQDIIIKARLAYYLFEITHNGKFVIYMHTDSPEKIKSTEERILEWYEKNKGKMCFDGKGRFKLGDPPKYKPTAKSNEPSEKMINGYIRIIEGMFDVKLNKEEKAIMRQEMIFLYKEEDEEDKEQDFREFENFVETADEEAWDEFMKEAKLGLEQIRSGNLVAENPQASFCSDYEEGKKLRYKNPAYELIHKLCNDLFGSKYQELLEKYR